jgi:hypothetical protein
MAQSYCGGIPLPRAHAWDVKVTDASLSLSLELGLDLFRKRRSIGDFRQGAFGIFRFGHLRTDAVPLGDRCRQGDDGRAQRTNLRNPTTGGVTKVDLWRN